MRTQAIAILACIIAGTFIYEGYADSFFDFSRGSSPATNHYEMGEHQGWLEVRARDFGGNAISYKGLRLNDDGTVTSVAGSLADRFLGYTNGLTGLFIGLMGTNAAPSRNAVYNGDVYSMIFDDPSRYVTAPFAEQGSELANLSSMAALDTSLENNASGFYNPAGDS